MTATLSRRTMLKGMGCAIALPWVEAMGWSADPPGSPASPPLRMAYLFAPNGTLAMNWQDAGGDINNLPPTLQVLAPVIQDVLVIKGLCNPIAHADPATLPFGHAPPTAAWLTCTAPHLGLANRVGISVDQVAAQRLGHQTMLPSLELGNEAVNGYDCDGPNCDYVENISWRSESEPMTKEVSPWAVYNRLFKDLTQPTSAQQAAVQKAVRGSVLDLVRAQGASLRSHLGVDDRHRVDDYLESVRAIEIRIQRSGERTARLKREGGALPLPEGMPPPDAPIPYLHHLDLLVDLMVLAFQSDATRISTLMLAKEGSQYPFPELGVNMGHHGCSHHNGSPAAIAGLAKIDRCYLGRYLRLLEGMRAVREGDGTLLDHSMIVYGCSISNGNAHNLDNLPLLLAGRGNGTIRPGRFLQCPANERLANLHLALLKRMGVAADRFGDSTRALEGLL